MPRDCEVLTTTGRLLLVTMSLMHEKGRQEVTKCELANAMRVHRNTVHQLLKEFSSSGWVIAAASVNEQNGGHKPTLYSLTPAAPTLSECLAIEAAG